jgi:hypothetical protein
MSLARGAGRRQEEHLMSEAVRRCELRPGRVGFHVLPRLKAAGR